MEDFFTCILSSRYLCLPLHARSSEVKKFSPRPIKDNGFTEDDRHILNKQSA